MTTSEMEFYLDQKPRTDLSIENFFRIFMGSYVYVLLHEPLPENSSDEKDRVKAGTMVPIVTVDREAQQLPAFIPVYTSMDKMKQAIEQGYQYYMQLQGRELLELCRGAEFAINNYDENFYYLTAEAAEYTLNYFSSNRIVLEKETNFMLGDPEVDPEGLKEELVAFFRKNDLIKKAHLCLAVEEGTGTRSYAILIEWETAPDESDKKHFEDRMGDASSGWLPKGYFMDIYHYESTNGFHNAIMNNGRCFYTRQ